MVKTAIGVAAAGLATGAAIITIAVSSHQRESRQTDINVAVCTAVEKLDGAISDSLRRSLVNLPKLQYYREHPDELDTQRREIKRSLNQFRPPPECGKEVVGR